MKWNNTTWRKWHMETSEIKAVLDSDFEKLLRRLNVYDDIVEGKATCAFCNKAVSLSNISMVFPNDGKVCFCCDQKECTDKLFKNRGFEK